MFISSHKTSHKFVTFTELNFDVSYYYYFLQIIHHLSQTNKYERIFKFRISSAYGLAYKPFQEILQIPGNTADSRKYCGFRLRVY